MLVKTLPIASSSCSMLLIFIAMGEVCEGFNTNLVGTGTNVFEAVLSFTWDEVHVAALQTNREGDSVARNFLLGSGSVSLSSSQPCIYFIIQFFSIFCFRGVLLLFIISLSLFDHFFKKCTKYWRLFYHFFLFILCELLSFLGGIEGCVFFHNKSLPKVLMLLSLDCQ